MTSESPVAGLTTRPATGTTWRDDALCSQTDPEIFFPEKGGSSRDAKEVCMACPVRIQCLDYALTTMQQHGIWGGLSERDRRKLRPTYVGGKAPAPCGTTAAYQRHVRKGEVIDDACREASRTNSARRREEAA